MHEANFKDPLTTAEEDIDGIEIRIKIVNSLHQSAA